MKIDYFKYTDKGPRPNNQDRLEAVQFGHLFFACVADGVGGGRCGDVAAHESILSFIDSLSQGADDLTKMIDKADNWLKRKQHENPECTGMATTFTGCTIAGNTLKMIHAGDSRLCVIRGEELMQLSDNHTEVELLLKSGQLTPEEAEVYPRRNVILSALGIYGSPLVQEAAFELAPGDRILLTSDGVHEKTTVAELIDLSLASETITQFGEALITLLSTKILTDNVSFVALSVV